MKIDILVYAPTSMLPTPGVIELPEDWTYDHLNAAIKPWIGGSINHIEHVSVLFRGARHDMYVDDHGAIQRGNRAPLPVNDAATLIYHEASRTSGRSLEGAPRIHGRAVITLKRTWYYAANNRAC